MEVKVKVAGAGAGAGAGTGAGAGGEGDGEGEGEERCNSQAFALKDGQDQRVVKLLREVVFGLLVPNDDRLVRSELDL